MFDNVFAREYLLFFIFGEVRKGAFVDIRFIDGNGGNCTFIKNKNKKNSSTEACMSISANQCK